VTCKTGERELVDEAATNWPEELIEPRVFVGLSEVPTQSSLVPTQICIFEIVEEEGFDTLVVIRIKLAVWPRTYVFWTVREAPLTTNVR